jgi:chemotaxis protein MotB
MAEEKKQKCPAGAPLWMCTFADLMSLLLCFFVLLLSFSNTDPQKYKVVAGSMEEAFGVQKKMRVMDSPYGQDIMAKDFKSVPLEIQTQIMDMISSEISSGMIDVEPAPEEITLRIKDSIAFDFGKAVIKKPFYPILDKLGGIFKGMDVVVFVSGHTDNLPVRKGLQFDSNWDLSAARAVNIVEYWTDRFKIPAEKLSAAGFADGRPLATNDTVEGRAKNRRVEFKITPMKKNQPLGELNLVDSVIVH